MAYIPYQFNYEGEFIGFSPLLCEYLEKKKEDAMGRMTQKERDWEREGVRYRVLNSGPQLPYISLKYFLLYASLPIAKGKETPP